MQTDRHDLPYELDSTSTASIPGSAAADASGVSANDRQWAAIAHFAALLAALVTSWFAGIAGVFAALIVWLVVRDRSRFAAEHAKEAINFNLSMFLYAVVGMLFAVFTLGIGLLVVLPLWGILALAWIVLTIIAGFRAYDGERYRYPLTIRFV